MLGKEYIDKLVERLRADGAFPEVRRFGHAVSFEDGWGLFTALGAAAVPGFRVTEGNAAAYAALVGWAVNAPFRCLDPDTGVEVEGDPRKGLYIAGNPGSGKTAAVRLLRLLLSEVGARYQYGNDSVAMRWADRTASMVCETYAAGGSLAPVQADKVICVHDLGSEPRETLYMGNRHEVMRELLELRGDTPGRFTILTSNLNFSTVRKVYGDRVWSRLHQMCNYVRLVDSDHRVGGLSKISPSVELSAGGLRKPTIP